MPINYKAYKDVDGEIKFYEEGATADAGNAVDVELTRVEGLDETTSTDGTTVETPPAAHTHTASEITDFGSQVRAQQNNPTLTKIGNNLRLDDGNGTNYDIDLSVYIDDTNLARIESGVLNATTSIATFTRDDGSTFTLDLSALMGGATPTITETIAQDPGTDVTVSELEELTTGVETTLHKHPFPFCDFVSSIGARAHQSTSFFTYITLSTTIPETGKYKLEWNYQWANTLLAGHPEETISSRLGRAEIAGARYWWVKFLRVVVDILAYPFDGPKHCKNAAEYEGLKMDLKMEVWDWTK